MKFLRNLVVALGIVVSYGVVGHFDFEDSQRVMNSHWNRAEMVYNEDY